MRLSLLRVMTSGTALALPTPIQMVIWSMGREWREMALCEVKAIL